MWQNFTERARQVVYYAQEETKRLGQHLVGPEHLLLGMTRVSDSAGSEILARLGASLETVRTRIEARVSPGQSVSDADLQLTQAAKHVIDLSYAAAKALKHNYIGVEHLLLGLVDEKESLAAQVLTGLGVTRDAIQDQLRQMQDAGETPPFDRPPQEELLTLDEAVQFLNTSKPTLYRVLGQGDLKGLKVGRQWRFRKADLVAYMERSPVAVAAAPAEELDTELAFFAEQLEKIGGRLAGPSDLAPAGEAYAAGEQKTIQIAESILNLAIRLRASDIHLEPILLAGVTVLLLRYRVDGVLQEVRRLPMTMHESLTARVKTMADMNMAEKRVPQDGRIPVRFEDKDFDLRVSVVPSLLGEGIVIRIILKSDVLIGLDNLGLAVDDLDQIRGLVRRPNGLFIVTGPTGAGKTTTLYGCLGEIARPEIKTLTIEDPVEVQMPYVTQVQVNKRAGVTFPVGLRTFLRQDPDVLFVGEVRDLETVTLAVEASLTGHLVLTTLHTSDAPSALTRLLEMGFAPYLIAATVTGVLAQRLCRRLCNDCKESYQVPARELVRFGLEPDDPEQTITLYRGKGCDQCRHKGYRGRIGLFELLVMTDELADLIVKGAPPADVAAAARASGANSLWQDGLLKVLGGVTAPDEVLRVCSAI